MASCDFLCGHDPWYACGFPCPRRDFFSSVLLTGDAKYVLDWIAVSFEGCHRGLLVSYVHISNSSAGDKLASISDVDRPVLNNNFEQLQVDSNTH
jgi:hypothetical protein